jgi:hypothetical protein
MHCGRRMAHSDCTCWARRARSLELQLLRSSPWPLQSSVRLCSTCRSGQQTGAMSSPCACTFSCMAPLMTHMYLIMHSHSSFRALAQQWQHFSPPDV